MRPLSPLFLLAALGVLSTTATQALAVDTSQWKCESCPFEKAGASATVDAGVGVVSGEPGKFGDASGLDKKGAVLLAGGAARWRGSDGYYGSLRADNLGLDSRSVDARVGQEGLYVLNLSYAELPHFVADTSTLPAPLSYKRTRIDGGLSWEFLPEWTARVSLRHDVRDGTRSQAGSFFSTASQLVIPVDQVTDQLEVSTAYTTNKLHASLAWQLSTFRNNQDSLTWSSPFPPVVAGADTGQLALAPDNSFHQIVATAGYDITPWLRASGEFAMGQMAQDAPFLDATLNPLLAATLPALPATSLHGRVDTLDASLRLSATPIEALRLNVVYTRDERNNRTPSLSLPSVSTDIFLNADPRVSQPYGFTQDKLRGDADYRWSSSLRTTVGAETQRTERTLQDAASTREDTFWGRGSFQWHSDLAMSLKLTHAERSHSTYSVVNWLESPDNPLMRKFNLADRLRDQASLRADWNATEALSMGLAVELANDEYEHSIIGLTDDRDVHLGADLSYAFTDDTHLQLYAQSERIRSNVAGSQQFALPDWTGRNTDVVTLVGAGVKQVALDGKLELSADVAAARSRSDVAVDAIVNSPGFPTATTSTRTVKLQATYQMQKNLSLVGSFWYEKYDSQDWRLDGIAPATVPNLLTLGMQSPKYTVNVFQVGVRYRF